MKFAILAFLLATTLAEEANRHQSFAVFNGEERSLGISSKFSYEDAATIANPDSADPSVVWQQHEETAIYNWVALGNSGQDLSASTFLKKPYSELMLESQQKQTWQILASDISAQCEVASSTNGKVTVAAEWVEAGYQFSGTIRVMNTESATPLWEKKIDGVGAGNPSLAVSDDGENFVLVASVNNSYVIPGHARAFCFSTVSEEPVHVIDLPVGEYASQVTALTNDLRFGFTDGTIVHVVDCQAGELLWTYDRQYLGMSLSISPDGEYVSTAFETLEVFKKSGRTYAPYFSVPLSHQDNTVLPVASFTAFSAENKLAVAMFNGYTAKQVFIQVWDILAKNTSWSYDYKPVDFQEYQDTPSAMKFAADGKFLAVGSWGDSNHTNPTVHVFCAICGKVVYSFDTPGSVNTLDIFHSAETLRLAVGAKAVHANFQGAGGDLYSLKFDLTEKKEHCSNILSDAAPVVDLEMISSLNAQQGMTWVAGVNARFEGSTWGDVRRLMGTNINVDSMAAAGVPTSSNIRGFSSSEPIPSEFDSAKTFPGCVHPVRDQKSCGSCWAFGASEVLSDRACIAKKSSAVLSPEELVSCDTLDFGCGGGFLYYAWEFLESKGLVTEACLPYTAGSGTAPPCPANKCVDGSAWTPIKIKNGTLQYYGTEEQIQRAVMSGGPIEVAFTVYSDFMQYKSGVYQHSDHAIVLGGHAVKLIGWGVDESSHLPYWVIQNSWGPSWGINGTFWIRRGVNECGIEFNSIWGTVE